jgi:hypothetical protein
MLPAERTRALLAAGGLSLVLALWLGPVLLGLRPCSFEGGAQGLFPCSLRQPGRAVLVRVQRPEGWLWTRRQVTGRAAVGGP